MHELDDFYNAGFGWVCRHCERELAGTEGRSEHARFFVEGEAESKSPRMSNPALARWQDAAQTVLTCPRCSITEAVSKA
ncbi:MAG TPA: hypothetical protein VFZ49_04305 [Pyrinomonadaceae bacterium]